MNRPAVRAQRGAEIVLLIAVLISATLRGLTLSKAPDPLELEAAEGAMDMVLALTALLLLWRIGMLPEYGALLAAAWPLAPFIAIALASLAWSVSAPASLARAAILVGSTALAAYFAVRYTLRELVVIVAWYFAAAAALSLATAIVLPGIGTMEVPPYDGAWNGIFWHRNYLGSIMAMGSAALLTAAISSRRGRRVRAAIFGVCYALALALVWLSRSATGMILVLLLHACLFLAAAWTRWRGRLRGVHYWGIAGILLVSLAVGLTRLDQMLGIFNRNTTFTGRVALWQYLWESIAIRRPLLGHGLGTLWTSPDFRGSVRDALGWPYPVYIGDNGFVDVLLQLGIVGLCALALALVWALYSALGLLLKDRDLLSTIPLIVVIYVLLTNYTLSFFLETESFAWLSVLVFVLAAVRRLATYGTAPRMSTASVS